jgi:thiol-disulfide isomerase/thioredoxin
MSPRSLLVLVLAIGCHRGPPLPAGDIAATLTAPAANGSAFDPASLHGKPSLVMFVSITCPYCRATIPRAAAAAAAEGGNALLVFVNGSPGGVTSLMTTIKFPYPALVDDGTLKARYGVHAVPYTLVLGADGRARDALEGEQEETALRDALVAAR